MVIKSYLKQVVRGNFITFNCNFLDANNKPTTVANVNVTINYRNNFVPFSNTFPMTTNDSGNNWIALWDTSVSDADMVEWHIETIPSVDNDPTIAEDGQFRIIANDANI